ncbi:MAG: Outer membrane protein assembly factor BamA [Chlamydiae bacterium]|nr:Outer membrane protein assembly factor BamA [Chlamydiota bacterium]
MNLRSLFSFTFLFVLLFSAKGYSLDYQNQMINKINIVVQSDTQDIDKQAILNRLNTKAGHTFSQEEFDLDLKMLSQEFDKVDPKIYEEKDGLVITLYLTPKPTISEIDFVGNALFKSRRLEKELGLSKGTVFDRTEFNRGLKKLREFYIKEGFFESHVTYTLTPQEDDQIKIEIQIYEGRSGKIHSVKIEGISKKEQSKIKSFTVTAPYFILTSWFTTFGYLNEEHLEYDKAQIIEFFQNRGYADTIVNVQIKDSTKPGQVDIIFDINKGKKYTIQEITFSGNQQYTQDQLRQFIDVKKGDIYSPEALRRAANKIKDFYGKRGYIDTNVFYETHLVPEENAYRVHFQVDESDQYIIGLIRVIGNIRTKTSVILHESLLVPGETFDSRKLKATERRLMATNYFKRVNVYAKKPDTHQQKAPYVRDVYIEVEETSTGAFNVFGGFSSTDDFFVGVELTERNFNYKGIGSLHRKGLRAFRGNGEYLHIRVAPGRKDTNYNFTWMTPYLGDTLWRFGFDLARTENNAYNENVDIKTNSGSLFASYPINAFWTFGWRYTIENTYNKAKIKKDNEQKQAGVQTDKLPPGGVISSTGINFNYDNTDNVQKPNRGFRSNLEAAYAGLGGDFEYTRLGYINSYYISLKKLGIIKTRFDVKVSLPFGKTNPETMPSNKRFYMGGENTVRGYRPYHIGKKDSDGNPLGGISYALGSIEYIYPIPFFYPIFETFQFFAFFDAGALTNTRWFKDVQTPQYLQIKKENAQKDESQYEATIQRNWGLSVGVGIRLNLLNQFPFTFGYGYPINEPYRGNVKNWFFSIGAQY